MPTWNKVTITKDELHEDEAGAATGKRIYFCEAAAPVTPDEALTANDGTTAVAARGASFSTGRVACVAKLRDTRRVTPWQIEVTVTFKDPALGTFGDNPLSVPVDYDWDFSLSSQTYFKDQSTPDPKFVVNSFGDPFDNLLSRETGEIVVTVTDNIVASAWHPVTAAQYVRPATAVNDAAMTIDGIDIDIAQARIGGIRCSGIRTSNGIEYRTRTIVLKLRESWDDDVDDRGFNEMVDDGTGTEYPFPITTNDGQRVAKPWPMDGAAHAKANATDAPEVLTFKPYPRRDFGIWGIT